MSELFLNWYFTASCIITLLLLVIFIIFQRNEILSDIKDVINNPDDKDALLMLILGILFLFFSPILLAVFLTALLIKAILKLLKS